MNVEALIDELEETIEKGFKLPLTNKLIVEYDKVKELIDEIKLAMPQEIRQAQTLVKERSVILEDAKKEAEAILKVADDKQRAMLNQNEIVRQAKLRAKEAKSEAEDRCRQLKNNANKYIEDSLKLADEILASNLNDLRKRREEFSKKTELEREQEKSKK